MRLEGKAAIVTGGGNGIGRATAVLFAREGASVAVADRDVEEGRACEAGIRKASGEGFYLETDVSRDADVAAVVQETVARYGGLDILVNCAGISIAGSVADTEPERWLRVMDVNVNGIYRMCRAAIPEMVRRGRGSVVNVSSIQGMFGYRQYAAYAASKAAIIGLTRQIAVDYAEEEIRANVVSPGGIRTKLGANNLWLEPAFVQNPSAYRKAATPSRPPSPGPVSPPRPCRLRQAGRPEEVAHAILFLASDEASYISGHNLVVDGIATARVD